MTQLPPPAPGSRPTPTATPSGPPADPPPARDWEWSWDSVRERLEWWFRPLADPAAWRAAASVAIGGVLAPLLFAAMVVAGAVSFGLLFVVVGLFLVVPSFALVAVLVGVDARVIELGGHAVELREPTPVDGVGPRSVVRAITDPTRWRFVGYLALNAIVGPTILGLLTTPVSLVLQGVFGGGPISGPGFSVGFDTGGFGLVGVIVGAVALGFLPRLALFLARVRAELAALVVGADRLAAAEERVSELSTQRSEILDAVANERRRIERNLHDGVQQQLVAIGLDLGMAEQQIERDPERARELLGLARGKVQGSIGELRQLGRGLHPAILADRGIDAALSAVVAGAPLPISVHVDPELDVSTDVAETVYFVANEAIANVLKHADARVASVHVDRVAANVRVTVHDDGRGGADVGRGTGLAGIRARVQAVDGRLDISSPAGGPTVIVAELPRHGRSTS